ncbi:hypothetical protein GCM10012276_18710 [Nocardioides deserti]|nr:hypothetical protein GCM10012276_18710 [Nocardioides deserti]
MPHPERVVGESVHGEQPGKRRDEDEAPAGQGEGPWPPASGAHGGCHRRAVYRAVTASIRGTCCSHRFRANPATRQREEPCGSLPDSAPGATKLRRLMSIREQVL